MNTRVGSRQNWTEKLARACARRPWATAGSWVVAIVLAAVAMSFWLGDALVTDVTPTNDPESTAALDLIDTRLGQTGDTTLDEIIIVRSPKYTVDDPRFAAVVNGIYGDIATQGPDVFLGGATYYTTGDPTLVSADRHTTMLPFTMPEGGDGHIPAVYAAGDAYASDDFQIYYTGSASWAADSMALGESTMARAEIIGIGAAPAGQFFQRFQYVGLFIVEHFGPAIALSHLQALRVAVYRDYTTCPKQERTLDCKLPHWSTAPNGHSVPSLNVAVFGRHVSGREDISQKQDFFVRQVLGNLVSADISEGTTRCQIRSMKRTLSDALSRPNVRMPRMGR